jgi:hypothetical protein
LKRGEEDSFDEFREWLISRGERIYRLAVRNPDALADDADPEAFAMDGFWLASREVYGDAFGEEIPLEVFDEVPLRLEPDGEPWAGDEESLEQRLPRLWARAEE